MPEWNKFVKNNKSRSKSILTTKIEESDLRGIMPKINGIEILGFPTIKINKDNKEFEYIGDKTEKSLSKFISRLK